MNLSLKALTPILFCLLFSSPVFAQGKLGTIDLQKVFDDYWKTKQAGLALKDQLADMNKELKNFETDYNKAKEEYDKLVAAAGDQALSAEARDKRKADAEKKLLDMKEIQQTTEQYKETANRTLAEKHKRMRDNVLTEIRAVINARAKAGNYGMVIDATAETPGGAPIILYKTGENDLADAVLSQLNSTAPKEPSKSEEKQGEKTEKPKKDEKK